MAIYEQLSEGLNPVERFDAWDEPNAMNAIDRVRLEIMEGLDTLVCESFIISAGTIKKTRGGSQQTIEIIGALRWIAHKRGTPFVLQSPGDSSMFDKNWKKLRRIGWYTPGDDHARSATRHLLLYLVKNGVIAPQRVIESTLEEGKVAAS
jgi:hypothetical protein